LKVAKAIGGAEHIDGTALIPGASWYTSKSTGDGFFYLDSPGFLQCSKCLTTDLLVEGSDLTVFGIVLQEGKSGRKFRFHACTLPSCSVRIRLDLGFIDQHRWVEDREGGILKTSCSAVLSRCRRWTA